MNLNNVLASKQDPLKKEVDKAKLITKTNG